MKGNKKSVQKTNALVAAIFLVLGLVAGFFGANLFSSKPATAQEIEKAKTQIAKLYEGKTVAACWTVNNGPNLAAGKYELTYRNLRINRHLNRAIITDCGEFDTLLAKDKSGKWAQTTVNLQIGNRVNPAWQKECLIEDITVPDDTVRPENNSIDQANLQECKQLKQR
jgi:hypothetical protein